MKRRRRDATAEWFTSFFDAAYVAQLREEKPPAQTRREVDFLLRALRPVPGARILDVPCGYGRHPLDPGRPAVRSSRPDHREHAARHRPRVAPGPTTSPALPAVLARPVAAHAPRGRAALPARLLGLRRAALSRGRDRASHRGRGAAAPP